MSEAQSIAHVWWAEARCLECPWLVDGDPTMTRAAAVTHASRERHETSVTATERQNFVPPSVPAPAVAA